MSRKFKHAVWALALGAGIVAFQSDILATVMMPLTIEQMSQRSAAILRGRVVVSTSAWDDAHRRIYTTTEVKVLDPIHRTKALGESVFIRSLGGEVGEIGMKVAGTPRFAPNEEVLLFLREDPLNQSQFQVVGMSQGKYRIERGAQGQVVATPSVEGLAFVRPSGSSGTLKVDPSVPRPDRLPLETLRLRILAAVGSQQPEGSQPSPTVPSAPTVPAVTPTPESLSP